MSEQAEVLRGVVEVVGPDARALLQRLVTNDVEGLDAGQARYAALLTPQGKIIADFLVVNVPTPETPDRFLLDCAALAAADLARRLTLYKLRAKVTISDRSDTLAAAPIEDGSLDARIHVYPDPRSSALGLRGVGPRALVASAAQASHAYDAHRVAAQVPQGGLDFAYNDTFPHEANLDRLHGVDFGKGCYVGQEVVSRMHHRGAVRTRVARFHWAGQGPASGDPVLAGQLSLGTVGTVTADAGLALVRVDRVAEALESGTKIDARGIALTFDIEQHASAPA